MLATEKFAVYWHEFLTHNLHLYFHQIRISYRTKGVKGLESKKLFLPVRLFSLSLYRELMHIQQWKNNSRKTTVFPHVKQEKCDENNKIFISKQPKTLKNICAMTRGVKDIVGSLGSRLVSGS